MLRHSGTPGHPGTPGTGESAHRRPIVLTGASIVRSTARRLLPRAAARARTPSRAARARITTAAHSRRRQMSHCTARTACALAPGDNVMRCTVRVTRRQRSRAWHGAPSTSRTAHRGIIALAAAGRGKGRAAGEIYQTRVRVRGLQVQPPPCAPPFVPCVAPSAAAPSALRSPLIQIHILSGCDDQRVT